jgi:hypothetical protein
MRCVGRRVAIAATREKGVKVEVILVVPVIWLGVALYASPIYWWKKTDRSQEPFDRRISAVVLALAWPRDLYHLISDRARDEQIAEQERVEAARRDSPG